MAPGKEGYVVYDAKSMQEANSVWWPLMKELGWNRAENDMATHWHVSRQSAWWMVAPSSSPSKPVGLTVPFIYDNKTAWVGFFILQAEARGKGWGAALFRATLEEFKRQGCEYVGLDAVPEQKKTYERRGFREVGLIKNMWRPSLKDEPLEGGVGEVEGLEVVNIRDVEPRKLVDFEERVTGFRRSRLWSKDGMWHRADDDAFGFAGRSSTGVLEGFVLVRVCEKGYRFGPVYASSEALAVALLHAAMKKTGELGEGILAAEVNMENKEAVKVFGNAGWKDAGVNYSRMWIDAKATPQQSPGGAAERECWAGFDASEG